MSDIEARLRSTGAERQKTTAHDLPDHYLHVVAKISQADGVLMREAAVEVERLRAALRPFANFCTAIDATEAGRLAPASQMIHAGLTVGAFRDARAALEKQ